MPLTVRSPIPPYIGPGVTVEWFTDDPGPLDPSTTIELRVFGPPPGPNEYYSAQSNTTVTQGLFHVFAEPQGVEISDYGNGQLDDNPCTVELVLQNGLGLHETASFTAPWSSTQGLGKQAALLASRQQGQGGGLTDQQAQQITNIELATHPALFIDNFTLVEVTSGPQGGTVGANLDNPIFGVLVRLSSVPPSPPAQTPDADYWIPTMAVFRLYRGSDLWMRVPVHTSSKLIPLQSETFMTFAADVLGAYWALDITVQVSFRVGVTGQVFLVRWQ